jgi:hypothetical protein
MKKIHPTAVIVNAQPVIAELLHCLKLAEMYLPHHLAGEHGKHLQRRRERITKAIKTAEEYI